MNNTKIINLFICLPSRFLMGYIIEKFKLYDLLIFSSLGFIYRYYSDPNRHFNNNRLLHSLLYFISYLTKDNLYIYLSNIFSIIYLIVNW
mgnify:FL=1